MAVNKNAEGVQSFLKVLIFLYTKVKNDFFQNHILL